MRSSAGAAVVVAVAFSSAVILSPPPTLIANQVIDAAWASLQTRVQSAGAVRVIVKLNVPFRAEGDLTPFTASAQRAAIAQSQEALLRTLALRNRDSVYVFETIPYIAMEVDTFDLEQLQLRPEVLDIQEDTLLDLFLAESTSLTGATAIQSEGYSGVGWSVAVLDSGVDKAHPFLAGKVVREACFSTNSYISSSVCPGGASSSTAAGSGTYCLYDGCSHGTHVAGIAAGKGASFSGVARDANIIAIQVMSAVAGGTSAFTSDVIRGLEHVYSLAGAYRIAAANLSLGGGRYFTNCDWRPLKPVIDNLRSIGVATVVASGNDGYVDSLSDPACISTAISVGSTGDGSNGSLQDSVSWFTNSASFLTLLAPGQSIYSSMPMGSYANLQGTSMAAPHVAGAWAVLKQAVPLASVDTIRAALVTTGRPVYDAGNGLTKPRIQIDDALAPLGLCRYSLSAVSVNAPANGGADSVLVGTFPHNCSWTATSNAGWLTITSGAGTQTGNVLVTYSIAPNTFNQSRTGTLSIAGRTFTVYQAGVPCTYTSGATPVFDPSGGPGSVTITPSAPDCSWSASTADSWVILRARTGVGPGAVTFDVAPNDTQDPRIGSIVVGAETVVLTQSGESAEGGCTFSFSPTSVTIDEDGGNRVVEVTPSSESCTWSARSNWPWITVNSPTDNVGTATLDLSVAANQNPTARTGAVLVGGLVLQVVQDRRPARLWDVDSDGRTDVTVWRPGTGMWFVVNSEDQSVTMTAWGSSLVNDIPVPGDYDGDGRGDVAVWRPGSGTWYVLTSSSGYTNFFTVNWGSGTVRDVPVPGDYDGDGKTDIAVWRPGTGFWYILKSTLDYAPASALMMEWGSGSVADVAVPADYDGDGITDLAVWRPGTGMWYVKTSTTNYTSYVATEWGAAAAGDRPVVGDYDGDGKADLAVWRVPTGTWYILRSSGGWFSTPWGSGALSDVPVVGDYDGDGRADLTVWRPGNGRWYTLQSSTDYEYAAAQSIEWGSGTVNDIPIPNR